MFHPLRRAIDSIFPAVNPAPIKTEPIPGLVWNSAMRVSSETVHVSDAEALETHPVDLMREIYAKVAAEDARMRRMLPPTPPGKVWLVELVARTEHFDPYDSGTQFKLIYRLGDRPPFGVQS